MDDPNPSSCSLNESDDVEQADINKVNIEMVKIMITMFLIEVEKRSISKLSLDSDDPWFGISDDGCLSSWEGNFCAFCFSGNC